MYRFVPFFVHLIITGLLGASLGAADWYVSPGGSDTNTGSQTQPWLTISKALTSSAASDRIYLQRGGTWRGTFILSGNRQLLAYGVGANPVVTASSSAAFTGTSGSAKTVAIAGQVLAVWIDGAFCRLARYPNVGASPEWLRVENGTTNTSIVDSGLKSRAAGFFTGAQVRWRRWSWWYETRQISADSGGATLTLANDMPGGTTDADYAGMSLGNSPDGQGSCYYIDNSLAELDAPGEWFWGDGTLRVILPTGSTATTVEYVTDTAGITLNGATVTGIDFSRFGGSALAVNNPSTIEDCHISEVEDTGIYTSWNAAPTIIRGNILRNVRNNGIYTNENFDGAGGTLIERNLLHRIGMERGYGGSGTWHQAGVILGIGKNNIMRLNRLIDIGYCGVIVGYPGQSIDRNLFDRTMSTLNDGAAIYTNCSSTMITANIILDTLGDLSNSHPWWPLGHGIWPEFLSDFHDQTIDDNTVFGSNGNGLVLNNEYTCLVRRNTLIGNRTGSLSLDIQYDASSQPNSYGVPENSDDDLRDQNHTISSNIFATTVPSNRLIRPENLNKWFLPPYAEPAPHLISGYDNVDHGTVNLSTFILPASGSDAFITKHWLNPSSTSQTKQTTLAAWTAANSSWAVGSTRLVTAKPYLLINDTENTASLPVPTGTWTLIDGTAVTGSVSVASFRSTVLLTSGSLPATPYSVASGVNWRLDTPTTTVLTTLPEIAVTRSGAISDGGTDLVTDTTPGAATELNYTISNTGGSPLTLSGTGAITGTDCTVAVTTAAATSVAAAGSTPLILTVTPTAVGAWNFPISFTTSDANESPTNWTVSGTATTLPEIAVTRSGAISDGGTDLVTDTTPGAATELNYTISNTGGSHLTLGGTGAITGTNCTVAVTTAAATSVAAAGSTPLILTVTPTAVGAWNFPISFTTNDANESPTNWTVSGAAVAGGSSTATSGGESSGGCGAGGLATLVLVGFGLLTLRQRLGCS